MVQVETAKICFFSKCFFFFFKRQMLRVREGGLINTAAVHLENWEPVAVIFTELLKYSVPWIVERFQWQATPYF